MTEIAVKKKIEGLSKLFSADNLFDMKQSALIIGYHPYWLRHLCRLKKIRHQRVLGRYYMTIDDIKAVLVSVAARK